MSTSLDSLSTELRRSCGDDLPDAEQALSVDQINRSLQRAVVMVNRDFGTGYRVLVDAVSPDLTISDKENLLLVAMVSVAEMMLARYSRYPSVKRGDKSVSRDGQVDAWSRLHARYLEQYKDAVAIYLASREDNVDPVLYG